MARSIVERGGIAACFGDLVAVSLVSGKTVKGRVIAVMREWVMFGRRRRMYPATAIAITTIQVLRKRQLGELPNPSWLD